MNALLISTFINQKVTLKFKHSNALNYTQAHDVLEIGEITHKCTCTVTHRHKYVIQQIIYYIILNIVDDNNNNIRQHMQYIKNV